MTSDRVSRASVAAVVDSTVAQAWGDVRRVPWVSVSAKHEHDAVGDAVDITLDVVVLPHVVSCPVFPKAVTRTGGGVTARSRVSLMDLAEAGVNSQRLVTDHTMQAIRFAAGLLREFDPRIGLLFQGTLPPKLGTFPRSALFDPPRLRPPEWKGAPALDSVACSVCHHAFGHGEPAMWGGGNLLWAHPACWLDVHEPSQG